MKTHIRIAFAKVRDVKTPSYGTPGSNGLDFYIPNDMPWESFTIRPGVSLGVPSGLKFDLPESWALVALPKSGRGSKGLLCGAPLIDSDYRGEVTIPVVNVSNDDITIKRGEKLVQFVLLQIPQIILIPTNENTFSKTVRGEAGFGSSGIS